MSVINRMLRDLDKRQPQSGAEALSVPQLQYYQPATSRLPWVLLVLALGALLLGGALAWYKLDLLQQDNWRLTQSVTDDLTRELAAVQQWEPQGTTQPSPVTENVTESPVTESPVMKSTETSTETVSADGNMPVAQHETDKTDDTVAVPVVTSVPESKAQAGAETLQSASASAVREDVSSEAIRPVSIAKITTQAEPLASSVSPASTLPKGAGQLAIKEVRLSPQALAEKRFAAGQAAQNEGRMMQAEIDFSEALKLNPQLHQARRYLAALYYGQGMMAQAETVLSQGVTLFPLEYEYGLLLARVYDAAGTTDKALLRLASIPDTSDLAKQKWSMQSQLAQQQGAFPLAEQSYRQLARLEPHEAKWWMGLAYALDSQSQFSSAKQAYRQALAQDGLSTQAVEFIEHRLIQLGEIQ